MEQRAPGHGAAEEGGGSSRAPSTAPESQVMPKFPGTGTQIILSHSDHPLARATGHFSQEKSMPLLPHKTLVRSSQE